MNRALIWILTMATLSIPSVAAEQKDASRTFTNSALGYQLVADGPWEALDAAGLAAVEKLFQQSAGSAAAVQQLKVSVSFALVSAHESGNSMLMALQAAMPATVAPEEIVSSFLAGVRASGQPGGTTPSTKQISLGGETFSVLSAESPAASAPGRMRVFVTTRKGHLLAFIGVAANNQAEKAIDDVLKTLVFSL